MRTTPAETLASVESRSQPRVLPDECYSSDVQAKCRVGETLASLGEQAWTVKGRWAVYR